MQRMIGSNFSKTESKHALKMRNIISYRCDSVVTNCDNINYEFNAFLCAGHTKKLLIAKRHAAYILHVKTKNRIPCGCFSNRTRWYYHLCTSSWSLRPKWRAPITHAPSELTEFKSKMKSFFSPRRTFVARAGMSTLLSSHQSGAGKPSGYSSLSVALESIGKNACPADHGFHEHA